jgi:hypothetical protein
MLIAATLSSIQLLVPPVKADSANWWNNSWSHRKSHVINQAIGADVNYQVQITVVNGSGSDSGDIVYSDNKTQTSFDDVRFVASDNTTSLDFWIETLNIGKNATFWVEISANLTASATTIWMYYGNNAATSASNATNTMLWYDDFNRATLGSAYTIENGSWSIENGSNLQQTTSAATYYSMFVTSLTSSTNYEMRYKWKAAGTLCDSGGIVRATANDTSIYLERQNTAAYLWKRPTATNYTYTTLTAAGTSWHDHKIQIWGTTRYRFYEDNSSKINYTGVLGIDSGAPGLATYYTATPFRFDDLIVRKFIDPEPAHGAWGTEETFTGSSAIYVDPTPTTVTLGSDCIIYVRTANVTDLYAWEFQLNYDPTILDLTSTAIVSGGLNEPTQTFQSITNETAGNLWWAVSTKYPTLTGIAYSDHAIFEIHFHTIAAGTSSLHLFGTILSDSNGNPMVHTVTDGTLTVNVIYIPNLIITNINVLNLNCSIYANDTHVNGTRYYYPVEVTAYNNGNSIAGPFQVKLEAHSVTGGLILEAQQEQSVPSLAAGASTIINFTELFNPKHTGFYRLRATADSRNEVLESNETDNSLQNDNLPVTVVGDINGDHTVSILDANVIALAWGDTNSDSWWNIKADLTHDGKIDILDATRIGLHWDESW